MTRIYPSAPVCAVGAIVFRDSSVLLIRRAKAPGAGKWSIPGGIVHLGESLEEAVVRELREEIQLEAKPLHVGKVLDRICKDATGRISYHYVIVDYVCEVGAGEPQPASDASEAGYFEIDHLDALDMTEGTAEVIREVYEKWRGEARLESCTT